MNNSKDIAHNITQKDEAKAIAAAKEIVQNKNVAAFEILCEKSAFLFDFIKENVKNRIKKVVTKENYKNLLAFSQIYSNDFSPTFVECLVKYADEDLTDEIYELLENGDIAQKTFASKYFCYIPDTIAQDILIKEAFSQNEILAANCATALGIMKETTTYEKALKLLRSDDDFEVLSAVKFLVSFGDKKAVEEILKCLETTSMAENIASEILCMISINELIENHGLYSALGCLDHTIVGLSEILPLENLFCYEMYEILNDLMEKNLKEKDSKIAQVLLRAWEKFDTISNNEEYIFDESKEIKQEVKEIFALLNSKGNNFIQEQKNLLLQELTKDKKRIQSALEVIQELQIKEATQVLKELLEKTTDENLIVQIAGTIKILGGFDSIDKNKLSQKITNINLKALVESY